MKSLHNITFLSDFGWCGGYVAACEATMVRVCPQARVLHVSHEVPVGDVAAEPLVLARVAPLCPEAVHLAVVDPGVGTARRPVALATARGDLLVGPDNGLLIDAAEALGGLTASLGARRRAGPHPCRSSAGGSLDHLPRARPVRACFGALGCRGRSGLPRPARGSRLPGAAGLQSRPGDRRGGVRSRHRDRPLRQRGPRAAFRRTPGRGAVRTPSSSSRWPATVCPNGPPGW